MSLCWYCYWGWPEPIAAIYQEALARLDGDESPLLYGPAHVVWAEENWHAAEDCLRTFEEFTGSYAPEELAIVKQSLHALAAIPLALRDVVPTTYDGEHPEQFPPPEGVVMVYRT